MKKLFRPFLVLACLAVFSVAAFAAVSPVLESKVEELVRNTLAASNSTVKEVKFNSTGTLVLSEFATTIKGGPHKGSLSISEIGIDIPLAFMPALIQPDVMLPKSGVVELASKVEMKNLVHTSAVAVNGKTVTSTSKTADLRLDKIRVDSATLRKLLAGDQDPATFVSFLYGIEIDSFVANNTTGDIPEENAVYKVAQSTAKGMKKAGYEEAGCTGVQIVDVEDKMVVDIDSMRVRGAHLPPEATLQALLALVEKNADPTGLLLQVLADPTPLVQEFRCDGMSIKEKGSKLASIGSIVYTGEDNWKRKFAISGLAVPASQLRQLGDVRAFLAGIDELHLDSSYVQYPDASGLKLETSYKSPELANIALNGTFAGDFGKAIVELVKNPMAGLGYKFKDIKLTIEDKSLLARTMATLGATPEMANTMVEMLLRQIFENPSEDTSKLVQVIRDFASKPGTLEVFTKPDQEIVATGFIAIALNPGALLNAKATQGSQSLGEQISALPIAGAPAGK